MKKTLALAIGMASASVACAAASPLDAAADVPGLRYQSAFTGYRSFDESTRADWREVNRVVDEASRKAGDSHSGHGTKPAAPASAAPMPPSGGHGSGHSGHGRMHGSTK